MVSGKRAGSVKSDSEISESLAQQWPIKFGRRKEQGNEEEKKNYLILKISFAHHNRNEIDPDFRSQ